MFRAPAVRERLVSRAQRRVELQLRQRVADIAERALTPRVEVNAHATVDDDDSSAGEIAGRLRVASETKCVEPAGAPRTWRREHVRATTFRGNKATSSISSMCERAPRGARGVERGAGARPDRRRRRTVLAEAPRDARVARRRSRQRQRALERRLADADDAKGATRRCAEGYRRTSNAAPPEALSVVGKRPRRRDGRARASRAPSRA